jgi:flagellar motor switch/type III secretory pathway protein FliN
MPLGSAIGLPPGAVVELDGSVDEPVELYVNGRPCGHGEILVGDDGRWGIRISHLIAPGS